MSDDPEAAKTLARDEAAVDALRRQVSALQKVRRELRRLAAANDDFETAGELRQRDAEVSERLEGLRMRLSRARAAGVAQGPSPAERRKHTAALARLDRYVRDDQNIHDCITYLMQIARCFK